MNALDTDVKEITEISALLADLVKCVVTRPDEVKVAHSIHGPLVAFVIRTDQEDVRRVIGARGKHFKALEAIMGGLLSRMGRESHLTLDEKGPPPNATRTKTTLMGQYNVRNFEQVKTLLKRVAGAFVLKPQEVGLISTDIANTTILELSVDKTDHPLIYGNEAQFEYGPDGNIIGAIKNIFDGIGKNHGRQVRIVLNQK